MHLEGLDRDAVQYKDHSGPSLQELRSLESDRTLHKGREAVHVEVIIVFFFTVTFAQVLLIVWRKRYSKSYRLVTLGGMWLIPLAISLMNVWWRFVFFWILFSGLTAYVVRRAHEKPTRGTTPRLVYKWFYFIYKLSYLLGICGYALFIVSFLELNIVLGIETQTVVDASIVVIFYGLYYGVLGQDIAEITTDTMTSHIGYYSAGGLPSRTLEEMVCAICGNEVSSLDGSAIREKTYVLTCNHRFHECCIRGWSIVGKKQTCPYCKEKFVYSEIFSNPWEKPHVIYSSLLSILRILVTWQPVIFALIHAFNYLLGLE